MDLGSLGFLPAWTIPGMVTITLVVGHLRGVHVYDAFIEGAREGLALVVRIFPYVMAIFVAVGIFRESGGLNLLIGAVRPLLEFFGLPGEILPLFIVRPLSGSAALAITTDILKTFGPDSFVGRLASIMQGSTDTTFYVLSLYFGSVGIRRTLYAVPVGLLGDLAGFTGAIIVTKLLFG